METQLTSTTTAAKKRKGNININKSETTKMNEREMKNIFPFFLLPNTYLSLINSIHTWLF